LIRKNVQISL